MLPWTVRMGGLQGGPEWGTIQCAVDQSIAPSRGLNPGVYLPAAAVLFGQEVPAGRAGKAA